MSMYCLDSSWKEIDEIIIFGYGRIGRRVIKKMGDNFRIPFLIDNNTLWQERTCKYPIYTLEMAKNQIGNRKIVVTTTDLIYLSIKKDLEAIGLVEYKDFCILSIFLGEWYLQYKNQLCVSKIDTIITSRCSLPCPHCGMFIHDCGRQCDYPIESLLENFDTVFKAIDYVMEYCLFGGEPLIFVELPRLIDYLMSHYGEKIGRLVLITNGNVRPNEEVIEILKKYNVFLAISNYTKKYDYAITLNQFLKRLDDNNINYSFNDEFVWKDFGYPRSPWRVSDKNAREHFRTCGHSTFCINNGILYYCGAMVGAEINMNYATKPDDVVNINEYIAIKGLMATKERILQYIKGDINEKGSPSFCQLCGGMGEDNQDYIEAGS